MYFGIVNLLFIMAAIYSVVYLPNVKQRYEHFY